MGKRKKYTQSYKASWGFCKYPTNKDIISGKSTCIQQLKTNVKLFFIWLWKKKEIFHEMLRYFNFIIGNLMNSWIFSNKDLLKIISPKNFTTN